MRHTNGRLFQVWDGVVLAAAFYLAITIPVCWAFGLETAPFGAIRWLITVLFALDFAFNLSKFTQRKAEGEFDDFEDREWFQSLLLGADFLAAIPFTLFLPYPILQLLPLLKLLRIHHIFKTLRQTMIRRVGLLTLLAFLFWLVVSINALACGWHAVGHVPERTDFTTEYIDALYWTITTLTAVGYGDITPVGNAQRLYAMFVEILGFGVFTFLIGTVASRLIRRDPATKRYQENMDSLAALMHYRSLPVSLQERIIDFYKHIWRKRLGYDETAFLESLPESLQTEVALHLKQEVIEKVPLFHDASDPFTQEIALLLKPVLLTPGDHVFRAGDAGDEMYFVVHGELHAVTPDEERLLTKMGPGDFFGEIALFKNQERSATVLAMTYCDIYALDKDSFDKVLARYPAVGRQIRETVEYRESKYSG